VRENATELRRVIDRIVGRILEGPVPLDLLEKLKAYGSPEKFLFWWLHHMRQDFAAYARTLTNMELADSLDYNSAYARSDMAKAAMIEASRRLRDGGETQLVEPPSRGNPPLKAEAVPE
jgi:hypothetical protein